MLVPQGAKERVNEELGSALDGQREVCGACFSPLTARSPFAGTQREGRGDEYIA